MDWIEPNQVVLKYVGGGVRARDIPARDLNAEDMAQLEEYTAERIMESPFQTLRDFLLATNLYIEVKAELPDRENKILRMSLNNKAVNDGNR